MNYYNEIDPYAAAWLRNLIAAGHIAPGDVDERSIEDVRPEELRGYTQCHFFAGIGVWSYALRRAHWPDDRPVWTGSCPCQPFSAAGKGGGTADERHLWPAWEWLIRHAKPRGVPVFGEQVASKAGLAWFDTVHADLEGQGYTVRAADLCAAGVGAPHIRQRLFFVEDAADEPRERHAGEILAAQARLDGARLAVNGGLPVRSEHAGEGVVSGSVADDDGRLGRERGQDASRSAGENTTERREGVSDVERSSDARNVGDASDAGLSVRKRKTLERAGRRQEGRAVVESSGSLDDLADTRGKGRQEQDRPATAGAARERLDDATSARQQSARQGAEGEARDEARMRGSEGGRGERATAGYWSPADWLPCIDGKARPVEPGTFPLAHGTPARVGRLRAYGNAIVAPLAAEFIKAYLEV